MDGENSWLKAMIAMLERFINLNHSCCKHAGGCTWWCQAYDLTSIPRNFKASMRNGTHSKAACQMYPDLPLRVRNAIYTRFDELNLTKTVRLNNVIDVLCGYMPEILLAHSDYLSARYITPGNHVPCLYSIVVIT